MVVRVVCRPGAFVRSGDVVALVWPANRIDERLARQVERSFRIGNQRTPTQDVECAVNQLVEMAVRAMSPAINDPFTANTCLDHMAIGLAKFIEQGGESPSSYDQKGQLRLVFEPITCAELFFAGFDMLRHASCDNANVLLHMIETIDTIGKASKSPQVRALLVDHARRIQAECKVGSLIADDRTRVDGNAEALIAKLKAVT